MFSVPTSISGLEHMNNLEEFWANNNSIEDFKEVGFLVKVKVIFLCPRCPSWPPTPLYWPCTWNTILFRWAKTWGPRTRYHKDILLFVLLYFTRKLLLFYVRQIFRKTPNTGGKSSLLCPLWLRSTPPYANETPWDDWRNGRTFCYSITVIIKFFSESLGSEGRSMWKWHPFPKNRDFKGAA